MWKTSVIGALLCAFSGVASAYRPGDEVCTLSADNQCAADTLKPSALDESVLIYPGGKTRCAFDDFTDPDGNFNTNKTYFFQVFPNQQQDKKKVLLYFQGGGACSGTDTCAFSLQCSLGKSNTFNPNAQAGSAGVLNRTNADNLFKDWNVVHIPYCTGDLNVGNANHSVAEGIFESFLNQSQCRNQNMTTYLNGYENTQAALKWALANYPTPEHLIIGGSSAGSLSAQALSAYVADMWKVESSSIRYSMLGDSYVGVLPDDEKPSSIVLDYFGTCDVELKVPADIVAACKAKTMGVVQLMSAVLKEVPFSDWLFIDSKADKTQRLFYELVQKGILGYPFTNLISGADFFAEVTTMINAYRTVSSRISTFFVEGEKHVFLYYDNYGSIVSDTGDKLSDFLAKWLLPHDDPTVAPSAGTPTTAPSSASAALTKSFVVLASALEMSSDARWMHWISPSSHQHQTHGVYILPDWLFIDSKADRTQRYFYQLVKDGILGYPFPNLLSGADFFSEVTTMVNAYRTVSSRISTFFVEGEKHVFLSYENYATVVSDTGEQLGAFLAKWLLPHDDPSVAPTPAPGPSSPSNPAPVSPGPSSTSVTPTSSPATTPSARPRC